jgi:Na+-translocating ferredoxin:NAD+ oxidoreductase RnfA subunit
MHKIVSVVIFFRHFFTKKTIIFTKKTIIFICPLFSTSLSVRPLNFLNFMQQENYQQSFKKAGFFDAIPVRSGISLGVGPPK